MTRQDLRLWYRQDNRKNIPDLDEFNNEYKEYVEWLEEGLMAAKQITQNLQSEIITIKNMKK